MIMAIYKRAFDILMKKPVRLWGISLLGSFLASAGSALFGLVPGVSIAIALLFDVSLTMIFLRGYRGEANPRAVDLFECFKDWATIKRVLCGMGWMLLWIFLWCLIPIVGIIFGIIRTYQYRLTPYILMMEPDVKPTEAIKLSKERTKGWKGKMFGADILVFVFFFVAMIILSLLTRIPVAGILFGIVTVLFCICFTLLVPLFLGLVQAAFYEEIQKWGTFPGNAAYAAPKRPAPAPGGYPPQGYDPQQYGQPYDQQYNQQYPPQYPPQGYDPQQYGQQYPPQYPQQPAWQPQPPQQPTWQPPQQPVWQPPQQPAAPDPGAWQPPQDMTPPEAPPQEPPQE